MRVALYVRVSTTEQSKKFSLQAQEQLLTTYASEQGVEVVRVYHEQCSGMHWESQKALMELIEAAEHGAFDAVLVTERDRLTRDPDGAAILKYIFAKKGIRLVVLSEPKTQAQSPTEDLIDGIISLIARYESQIRLVRVRRGMELAVNSGKHPGKAPLGYVNTPEGLQIDGQKATLIRRIFGDYAGGESIYALSRKTGLNASKVHYILSNPVYVGRIRWRGRVVDGRHPPLIPQGLWDRVRRRRGGCPEDIKGGRTKD